MKLTNQGLLLLIFLLSAHRREAWLIGGIANECPAKKDA